MSHKLFVKTMGVSDWRRQLAKPDLHWKRGRSAFEMAVAWEGARSRPDEMPKELGRPCGSIDLYLGWVQCAPAADAQVTQAV
jgi:hypothetical protein